MGWKGFTRYSLIMMLFCAAPDKPQNLAEDKSESDSIPSGMKEQTTITITPKIAKQNIYRS